MKNILKYIFLSFVFFTSQAIAQDNVELVAQCAASAGNVTYLKDFIVKLDAGIPGGKPPSAKFSMVLSKNTQYRFSICTAPDSEGEAILQLFDMNVLQGSTYISATGKEFPFFDFKSSARLFLLRLRRMKRDMNVKFSVDSVHNDPLFRINELLEDISFLLKD